MSTNYQVIEDPQNRWIDYIPDSPRDSFTILLFPALNTLHSMDSYGRYLAVHGYRVRSIKYEGQRERFKHFFASRKISTASIDDWQENIVEACSSLENETKPLAAVVYSIGASLLALYALKNPQTKIASVFALAPALALTKKAQLGLSFYRIISSLVGANTGVFPTMVRGENRVENFMSYNSYNKPNQVLEQIKFFVKKNHPTDSSIPWTVVVDEKDFLINQALLKTKLREYCFPNSKIVSVKGFGHEFAFPNYKDFPAQLNSLLANWLAEIEKI